jgi:hypothetical protein
MTDAVYTRSNGQTVAVKDMVTAHLKSAHAKLAREVPDHPELAGMKAEIARRDEAFAASQSEERLP